MHRRGCTPTSCPLFRDVDDALSEIVERGRTVHQLLNNALAASMTQASLRQNEDTRRISAWVAIGVVPTIVAGLFGMNLGGIPGAEHGLGFAIVTVLTLLVCVTLYKKFRSDRLVVAVATPSRRGGETRDPGDRHGHGARRRPT